MRRQIVHNKQVVDSLRDRGVIFVDEVGEVPAGAVTVFSAHGVAPAVREEAARRGLRTIDATCPLVTKVHKEARHLAGEGYDIVLIGQRGHDEVIGTAGQAPAHTHLVDGPQDVPGLRVRDPARVAWLSQTTLSVDEVATVVDKLREHFPLLLDPPSDDICYAAQNRQAAVRAIAGDCGLVLVVGSANSHNSNRLVQVALAPERPPPTSSRPPPTSRRDGWTVRQRFALPRELQRDLKAARKPPPVRGQAPISPRLGGPVRCQRRRATACAVG